MKELLDQIGQAVDKIKSISSIVPEYGIVLGTGLGKLADEIDVIDEIPYPEIPHFVSSTVESHSGKLLIGTLSGKNVVAMQGIPSGARAT